MRSDGINIAILRARHSLRGQQEFRLGSAYDLSVRRLGLAPCDFELAPALENRGSQSGDRKTGRVGDWGDEVPLIGRAIFVSPLPGLRQARKVPAVLGPRGPGYRMSALWASEASASAVRQPAAPRAGQAATPHTPRPRRYPPAPGAPGPGVRGRETRGQRVLRVERRWRSRGDRPGYPACAPARRGDAGLWSATPLALVHRKTLSLGDRDGAAGFGALPNGWRGSWQRWGFSAALSRRP
jgi:hypothetical protein